MAGTLVANTINTDTGVFSTNNAYLGIAKAWVNYNATTQTITNSFNVSSVTYVSSGLYTINYTTAMPNANYCISGTSTYGGGQNLFIFPYGSKTTALCQVYSVYYAAVADGTSVCVIIHGN